jgi:hypothetical protein
VSLRLVALVTSAAVAAGWLAHCSSPAATPGDGKASTGSAADAGGDSQVCAAPPDAGDLPCNVSAVFQLRCQHCHTTPKLPPPDNAPFPLRRYEDLSAPFGTTGLVRWQRVAQVIEPGNFPHMPPPTQPQPTPSDLDTLRTWFAACAPPVPEGTGCDVEDAGDAGDAGEGDGGEGDDEGGDTIVDAHQDESAASDAG